MSSPQHTGDTQALSVQLTVRPASTMGVLFALIQQDHVIFSISLSDYHPGKKEWTEVSVFCIPCPVKLF